MNKAIAILFALTCFATSTLSSRMLGFGMWFYIIIAVGAFVAVSHFIPVLVGVGSGLALLLACLSICAVALGLLAATIGGSFTMDTNSAMLLSLFLMIFVLGLSLAILYKKSLNAPEAPPKAQR